MHDIWCKLCYSTAVTQTPLLLIVESISCFQSKHWLRELADTAWTLLWRSWYLNFWGVSRRPQKCANAVLLLCFDVQCRRSGRAEDWRDGENAEGGAAGESQTYWIAGKTQAINSDWWEFLRRSCRYVNEQRRFGVRQHFSSRSIAFFCARKMIRSMFCSEASSPSFLLFLLSRFSSLSISSVEYFSLWMQLLFTNY